MSSATLTRGEAHDTVDAAAQLGALSHLAAHWDVPGHWNENDAYWNAECFHEYVDESADMLRDTRNGRNPSESDDTGLNAWEGVL